MKKLIDRRGMTLTELLCAIVVLLLVSALLVVGVNFSLRTFRDSMATSEAQTLRSTLTAAISDKLRYCTVDVVDGQLFIHGVGKVDEDEQGEVFHVDDATGQLYLGETKLLGAASYPEGLRLSKFTMRYDEADAIFTITFDIDDKANADTPRATANFQVQCLNRANT